MKISNSNVFKNCVIDAESMTITEYNKDECNVFDLKKVLTDWEGIDGITISIKKDTEVTGDE